MYPQYNNNKKKERKVCKTPSQPIAECSVVCLSSQVIAEAENGEDLSSRSALAGSSPDPVSTTKKLGMVAHAQ
jgi:hypothetical protein